MVYQQLGKSTLSVSKIGFGCMSLKGNGAENERILNTALERGINYFDTADLYEKGINETLVGKAFKNKRQQVVIATKVGNQWRADGSGWDWNPSKAYILEAVEQTLRRLQTDYIDLYQLHGGIIEDPIDETIEAFELLQQQGKIRFYGISSIRPNVIKAYAGRSNIVSVMLQYSLLDRRPEEAILPLLKGKNIGVLARGSLAQGLLINKPAKAYLNYTIEQVDKIARAVKKIKGKTASETALQFVWTSPAVTSAIVGIRTPEQLEAAIESVESQPLTEEELRNLQNIEPANVHDQHR